MPILIVLAGVLLLFLLITVVRLNAFIAFLLVALSVGVAEGLGVIETVGAIQKGIGNTLGSLVMILGLGAMLGKIVADSGAAQQITQKLVDAFGVRYIQWALMLTGFLVGIPMFYTVAFVILVPLVFAIGARTGLPLLFVGLPMLASLSVTHGFLPPHPAPTAISQTFSADLGLTLLLGLGIALFAALIIVPLFGRITKKYTAQPLDTFKVEPLPEDQLPPFGLSILVGLMPVILIGVTTVIKFFTPESSSLFLVAETIGNPAIAMLLSVLIAIYALGIRRGKDMATVMKQVSASVSDITMVLFIIAGAGGLKEVLIQSGVSDYIGAAMEGIAVSPYLLAWGIAATIRVCVGSATVSGLTAAGIVLPIIQQTGASPELMVLAVGAGSIFFSHVNDAGFWLFKGYFNLSIKETLSTWTLMETTVSIAGLVGVLVLSAVVG